MTDGLIAGKLQHKTTLMLAQILGRRIYPYALSGRAPRAKGGRMNMPPTAVLTMSSQEIAKLANKLHDNVERGIHAMLVELYGEGGYSNLRTPTSTSKTSRPTRFSAAQAGGLDLGTQRGTQASTQPSKGASPMSCRYIYQGKKYEA